MPDEKTATELWAALRAGLLQGTPAIDVALAITLKLLAALEEVKERKNQVCEGYELCRHVGCASSYEAFAIADKALADARAELLEATE